MILSKLRPCLFFGIAATFLQVHCLPIDAQEQSTDFVPKEAFAAILADLGTLKQTPGAEYFPHEIVSAFGKRDYGFDPANIESAKLIFGLNETIPEQGPLVGVILELKKEFKIADRFADQGPATVVEGTEIYFDENLQNAFRPRQSENCVAGFNGALCVVDVLFPEYQKSVYQTSSQNQNRITNKDCHFGRKAEKFHRNGCVG